MEDAYDFIRNFVFDEMKLLQFLQKVYTHSHPIFVDTLYAKDVFLDIEANNNALYKIINDFCTKRINNVSNEK
jgi:hypothetical protein